VPYRHVNKWILVYRISYVVCRILRLHSEQVSYLVFRIAPDRKASELTSGVNSGVLCGTLFIVNGSLTGPAGRAGLRRKSSPRPPVIGKGSGSFPVASQVSSSRG